MAYSSWSVVFGEIPSAAKWNILGTNDAHFYSFLGDNLAWQSWVPTFVNLSGGTLNFAKYIQIGKTVLYRWKYTLAGAGVAGDVTFTLPVAAHSNYSTTAVSPMGDVNFRDTGTDNFYGQVKWSSSGIAVIRAMAAGGTYLTNNTALSSTVPFTWANTDEIYAQGHYEAA